MPLFSFLPEILSAPAESICFQVARPKIFILRSPPGRGSGSPPGLLRRHPYFYIASPNRT